MITRFFLHTRFGWYLMDLLMAASLVMMGVGVVMVGLPNTTSRRLGTGAAIVLAALWILLERHQHAVDYKTGWRSGFVSGVMQDPTAIVRDAVTGEVAPAPWEDNNRILRVEFHRVANDTKDTDAN